MLFNFLKKGLIWESAAARFLQKVGFLAEPESLPPGDFNSLEAAQPVCPSEPSVSRMPCLPIPRVPPSKCLGSAVPTPPPSSSEELGPTRIQPARNTRETAGFPQAPWTWASEITAGQGGAALPYPPARTWSRERGNGEEEAGDTATPLSSLQLPSAPAAAASGAGGPQPQARTGCTAYGAPGGPNHTWHRGLPADAPPRRSQAPPPGSGSGSAAALAPPSASGVPSRCSSW